MSDPSRATARDTAKQDQPPPSGMAAVTKMSSGFPVVTVLSFLMLLGGLGFYYFNEKKQLGGEILIDQIEEISGEYSGISQQSDKPDAQRILWIKTPARLRGSRLDYQQAQQLNGLVDGDPLQVWVAPKVQGSQTMWVVKAASDGSVLIGETADRLAE